MGSCLCLLKKIVVDGNGDCCQWMGVVCHNVTGHVHQLHLRSFPPIWDEFTTDDDQNEAQYEAYWRPMFGGKLNPSLLDLKYLNYLDLSYNDFSGTQIPKFLGSMESLRYLNLSNARFKGVIPHQLGNLSNLQYLNLEGYSSYDLYVNNLQWLSGLPLLQHLDMSSVNLRKSSDWLQVTNKLPSLLELRLSDCELPFIPPTPSVNFSSVTTLDLSRNRFENTLILSWIVGLCNLLFLDLSSSFQGGPIPVVLQNMTSLRHLDLSYNYFNHSIPNWLYSFSRLEFLNLRSNNLQGQIPSSMSSLTFLNHLNLSNNNLIGKIPLSTQLQSFDASSFSGNKLCGKPLTDNCTINGVKPNSDTIGSRLEVDWFYVSMALGFVVGFWGVCGPLLLNKQWRIMYFQFLDHMGYKLKGVLSFQYCECKGLISSQWRKLKLAASKVCGSDSFSRQVRWRLASSRHIKDSAGNKGWNIPITVFDSEVLTVGLVSLPFAFDDICPVIYSI
uniref:Leucine-rich repeat-containing N-terminal plant-type domain-containing protein n=1 Tax=Fagus sylvatica TaxID=28930 RepID=A0A2N9GTJ8_FAGSY